MPELSDFQAAFGQALSGDVGALAPWMASSDAERLAVYRNTVAKGSADAIAAQFPTVATVVGEAWLREAALAFAQGHLPAGPCLSDYGADFPAWLAGFPPAIDMPWLADLAAIDRARTETLFAADAPPLDPAALAALDPGAYADHGLALHPAARLLDFQAAVPDLWIALQVGPAAAELRPEPQGLLIVRPALEVGWHVLSPGGVALLAACQAGASLAEAGAAALAAEPGLPLAELFAHLIAAGAFAALCVS